MLKVAQRWKSLSKLPQSDPVFDSVPQPKPKKKQTHKIVKEGVIEQFQPVFQAPDPKFVPRLKHGLDRVLFNPGVHQLKDSRTGVYNFVQELEKITQPKHFNFDALPPFRRPSEDETLHRLAREGNAQFVGSTSSVSSALSQIYFALSRFKDASLKNLDSGGFNQADSTYTTLTRMATSVQVNPSKNINDVYTIDYYKNGIEDKITIMMRQGHILENFFTLDTEEFSRFLKGSVLKPKPADSMGSYAYCSYKNMLLRSQIDCMHPYLPKKTFDIKTRASVAIRLNADNYAEFVNYRVNKNHGWYNSFAKEYYDMIRSAFLKYCFQVRIGDMDGLFVSYHNTKQIFGFQYVSREELDDVLFGSTHIADNMFSFCLGVFQQVLQHARSLYPDCDKVRITLDAGAYGLKVYTSNEHGQVHKMLVQTDLLINDDIVDNFEAASVEDSLSVAYRIRQYKSQEGYQEQYNQLLERIAKRLTKSRDLDYGQRMRDRFLPYMSEDELDTLSARFWYDQV